MEYKLQDLIDIPLFQTLLDKLNEVYSFPSAIIDNEGTILTATAWQDICTKFHRVNKESELECIKSDQYISEHLHEANPAVSYRCPHGMIDNATPIIVNGKHLGNFFTGQIFLDNPDMNFFKAQAKRFGFDETKYLEAVSKVPIWSKPILDNYLGVIKSFTEILAQIGLKNLKEAEYRKILEQSEIELKHKNEEYETINEELKETNEHLSTAKQKAEESDRLKLAFLANISHEIRTPMNAIKGFSDLICKKNLPDEKRLKFADIIKQRGDDLLAIIDDLIDISKIDSKQMLINETKGKLSTLIQELSVFFNTKNQYFDKKQIDLIIEYKIDEANDFIRTDFNRLKQVLINLISNAYKFTQEGYIKIGCKINPENKLFFYVEDTGIGIEKSGQSIIFTPFRQVNENYLTDKFGGVGLGLSISKSLIELMGGTMWIESVPTKGSTFYFTLPYIQVEAEPEGSVNLLPETINWSSKTILLIEDNEINAHYLNEILEGTQISIKHAWDGKSAIEIFKTTDKIDLVLLDIKLPDINGFDVSKTIKEINSNCIIIAQTAFTSDLDQKKAIQSGCADFLSKPISREKLINTMKKFLIDKN